MLRSTLLAAALALAAPVVAADPPPVAIPYNSLVAFTTVDAVQVTPVNAYGDRLYLTGVVDGEATASVRYVPVAATASGTEWCQRYALVMMERPGRYRLEVMYSGNVSCKLVRVAP